MMEKEKVEFKERQENAEVAVFLEGLLKGFKDGLVVVEHGSECLSLTPAGLIAVEVKAKRKKDKEKFSLELSWRVAALEASGELAGEAPPAGALKIEGQQPAPPAKSGKEISGENKDEPGKPGKSSGSETAPGTLLKK